MADPTVSGKTCEGNHTEPANSFGYISFSNGNRVTLHELQERLQVITEMSSGMNAVMEKIIDSPDMDTETAGIARLIRAGVNEILEQATRLEPQDNGRTRMHGDAA